MKLKIGANDKKDGFKTLDIDPSLVPDILADVTDIPLEPNTCSYIICENVLEHVCDLKKAMDELVRITKPGGTIEIVLPHFSAFKLWDNLQHKRGGSYGMFDSYPVVRFKREFWIEGRGIVMPNTPTRWHIPFAVVEYIANRFPGIYEYWLCNFIRCDALHFVLIKL